MAYAGPHTLVTVAGNSWDGFETWSFGMRFSGSPPLTQAIADNVASLAKTWWITGGSGYRTEQSITHVKVAPIGPDGKYPAGLDSFESSAGMPAPGIFSAGAPQPAQIAMAMTLTTAVTRGIAHNTHIFLPAPSYGLQQGRWTAANAGSILANFRTFVLGLNGVGFGSLTVMSKKYGQQRTVTGFSLGLVPDTMRSRRRSIPEAPVLLAL